MSGPAVVAIPATLITARTAAMALGANPPPRQDVVRERVHLDGEVVPSGPHRAVDAFAQEVGVAVVPGVLVDQVEHDQPQ